jgi:hypothetical protein
MAGKNAFVASGSYNIIAAYKTPSGALKIKSYGPYKQLSGKKGAVEAKRQILSENAELAAAYIRKQIKIYIVPNFEYRPVVDNGNTDTDWLHGVANNGN